MPRGTLGKAECNVLYRSVQRVTCWIFLQCSHASEIVRWITRLNLKTVTLLQARPSIVCILCSSRVCHRLLHLSGYLNQLCIYWSCDLFAVLKTWGNICYVHLYSYSIMSSAIYVTWSGLLILFVACLFNLSWNRQGIYRKYPLW